LTVFLAVFFAVFLAVVFTAFFVAFLAVFFAVVFFAAVLRAGEVAPVVPEASALFSGLLLSDGVLAATYDLS